MDLNVRVPQIDRQGLRTYEIAQMLREYMEELERQLRYVLSNIDTENLNEELAEKIDNAEALTQVFRRQFANADAKSAFEQTAQMVNMSVKSGDVINEINLDKSGARIKAARIALEGLTTINGAFKVLLDGSFEATGGKIGGWTVDETSLYTGMNTRNQAPNQYLGQGDLKGLVSIAGSSERRDWRMKIGNGFGVTKDGAMYCENGVFRGTVSAGNVVGGGGYGKMEGGALVDHSVGEVQMEEYYAQMKKLLEGAMWAETTVGGKRMLTLVREAEG